MKKIIKWGLMVSFLFANIACSTPYIITLKDGSRIYTQEKPEYNNQTDFIEFIDNGGKEGSVNKDEVSDIREN